MEEITINEAEIGSQMVFPELDLLPNLITYSNLLDGLCKHGLLGDALELFK